MSKVSGYIKSGKLELCCGCRACELVCNKDAIIMSFNDEGFLYPKFESSSCIDCGMCAAVCPIVNFQKVKYKEGKTYAVQNLNKVDLRKSSSGGAFIAIAKKVLALGGVVYGAAYSKGTSVEIVRVDCEVDLEKLQGSKYVQSDTVSSYKSVQNDLREGRFVYFSGCPCQVAGLRLYLKTDYENLLLSDVICHGVPSGKLFDFVVSRIESCYDVRFVNYLFRDKMVKGWSCASSSSSFRTKSGKKKHFVYLRDMEAYFQAFISGDVMRMSCYSCPFASIERCGDLTLGDYWGAWIHHKDFPNIKKGVSLLMVNSAKGTSFFDALKSEVYSFPIEKEHAVEANTNLCVPTKKTENRMSSYKLAFDDYEAFKKKYCKDSFTKRIKVELQALFRKLFDYV